MKTVKELELALNAPGKAERLAALKELKSRIGKDIPTPVTGKDVNNHIHTTYSFSPYSPTAALYQAYMAGLRTAGIMDHDSLGGAREFIEAGEILAMPVTVGMEMRVDFSHTPFGGRRLNNPDQDSCAYMALHGVPHTRIDELQAAMEPYRAARNRRNEKMIARLNTRLEAAALSVSFEEDVLPLSEQGGGVTERHLLYAVSLKLLERFGKTQALIDFIAKSMGISISEKAAATLRDPANHLAAYDLLGVLKSDISAVYLPATEECMPVEKALQLAHENGAIAAYAYLGDVGESVTGDKRAQCFEDAFLDGLVPYLKQLGFNAITYMPSRNTHAQLARLMAMCEQYELFQISGEDINSPRQLFICKALQDPAYHHLITATWALIGHEQAATKNLENAMFSAQTAARFPALSQRIAHFAQLAQE